MKKRKRGNFMAVHDIVIFGNGMHAVFAACKAASEAPAKSVALIVPDVSGKLGGLASVGGQNYWDVSPWNGQVVTKGSFNWYLNKAESDPYYTGRGYNTDDLAEQLRISAANYSNLHIYYKSDIVNYTYNTSPFRITSVTIRSIKRNTAGVVVWDGTATTKIEGRMFVDASDDGKIARLINTSVTVGRHDWNPAVMTTAFTPEETGASVGRQQAASIMIKIKGINVNRLKTDNGHSNKEDFQTSTYSDGTIRHITGGNKTIKNSLTIKAFNKKYGTQNSMTDFRYVLKPMNIARNGKGKDEWWVNALLVFDVDGRAHERDKTTGFYPTDMLPDAKNTDEAWTAARDFVMGSQSNEFLDAMHEFPGFENVSVVGVGELMYIRETVHMAWDSSKRTRNSENNYALTGDMCKNAGAAPTAGADAVNYAKRIGLGFYPADIHPYEPRHVINTSTGEYYVDEYYTHIRSGIEDPINPVYLPFSMLMSNYVGNLILCGYAAGVSSYAWGEIRVLPNLAVLGDAAGVTAAYGVNNDTIPYYVNYNTTDIANIQARLRAVGARLDK